MTPGRLAELRDRGWRLTHDGSTSTAHLDWDDPDDPESGWEILVLHTAGHGGRLTLHVHGEGLTERRPPEARRLLEALSGALELAEEWSGELPKDEA